MNYSVLPLGYLHHTYVMIIYSHQMYISPLKYELLEGRSYMVPSTPAQSLTEHVQEHHAI